MIQYKTGDILSESADALVNTVNCVGVMGRGLALQFKRAFPKNFQAYAEQCRRGEMRPGRVFVFETGEAFPPRYIINFPSKRHWRGKSRIDDIESGLASLVNEIRVRDIRSVAIPPLGSGLGGLAWPVVRRRIQEAIGDLTEVDVVVFEPHGRLRAKRVARAPKVPGMTPGRAALVALMDRYLRGMMEPFVTLLEVHKLLYFMQEAGEPLRLRFEPGPYGPFADNLSHVLHAIEGYMVTGYADGGDEPRKQLELVPGALEDAKAFLQTKAATQANLERVVDLVEGFESPFGLELLATVHWVAKEREAATRKDIESLVYSWSDRKRMFSRRQLALAGDILAQKEWLVRMVDAEDGSSPLCQQERDTKGEDD